MLLRTIFIVLFTLATGRSVFSQTCLVLETQGKVKARKYPIGSVIKVHFKGEPRSNWEVYTITGFDLEAECIRVSDTYCVPLTVIDKFDISPSKNNKMQKAPSKFNVQWTYFQYFNGQKKLNKRNRLRIIDYSPYTR